MIKSKGLDFSLHVTSFIEYSFDFPKPKKRKRKKKGRKREGSSVQPFKVV